MQQLYIGMIGDQWCLAVMGYGNYDAWQAGKDKQSIEAVWRAWFYDCMCYNFSIFSLILSYLGTLAQMQIPALKPNNFSIPAATPGYRQTSWQVLYDFRIYQTIISIHKHVYKDLSYQPCTLASS